MSDGMCSLSTEADQIAWYLISACPNDRVKARYEDAIRMLNVELDAVDRRLWKIVTSCPFTFRIIDGGLAIVRPTSSIRRKVYIMLALLETSPEYCEYFLPKGFGSLYAVNIVWTGARALLVGLLGYVVLKLMGVKA
jgi:hypothetical protein